MKKILLALLLATSVALITPARAAELRAPTDGASITVSERETAKDLHITGENVTVNAPISGDLLAAGGSVVLTGSVEDSTFAVGGTVSTRGTVGRHLRLAGGEVTVSSVVNGDAFIAGGQVVIAEQAVISGDLFVAGGTVTVNGTIKGRVFVGGGTVIINGSVGSVKAHIDQLTLGEKAAINGDLAYWASGEAAIHQNATISGQTTFSKVSRTGTGQLRAFTTVGGLLTIVGTFILLWLAIRFRSQTTRALLDRFATSPLPMAGYGALTIFIAPLALILFIITIIGAPLALLGGLFWLVALALGSLLGKLFLGSWIVKTVTKSADYPLTWQTALVGVVASTLLLIIPVIGMAVAFGLFLIGLGVVVSFFFRRETVTNKA